MKRRSCRRGICLAVVLATGSAWTPAATGDPADALHNCRRLNDSAARLVCYDGIPVAPETSDAAGSDSPEAPSAEELFGRSAGDSEELVRSTAGIGKLDRLQARVTTVRRDAEGKLVLALDNGQSWAQIDTSATTVSAGDGVEIRRAAFGSYLLAPAGSSRGIRVRRVDRNPP